MLINKNNYKEEIYSATILLLSISKADDIIDDQELKLIKHIHFNLIIYPFNWHKNCIN